MNDLLTRLWRWITLADAPVNRVIPATSGCQVCGQPATCYVSITMNEWTTQGYTCLEHHQGFVQERIQGHGRT
jgi:hypothetical protein